MKRSLMMLLAALFAVPVMAKAESAFSDFGGDVFNAGRVVSHDSAGTDDLFLAGERVTGTADITGSAHLAGREISMDGAVGGDAYAAGEEISFTRAVSGDATFAGRDITVNGVGGDLRVAGSKLRLNGDIAGYAMVAGEYVEFDAAVAGDVSLAAENVFWGNSASINGRLIVYEKELGALEVPERIASADRIERREIERWDGPRPPSWDRVIASFLLGVLVVAGLAALIAVLVPERLAEMRRQILARPFYTLWMGFLTQSLIIGAGVILAMTIIGLILTPTMVLVALLAGFAGYVVAAYTFGVGLLLTIGKPEPASISDRALAAGIGALVVGLIGLIPFLGWLFVLTLALSGIGTITMRVIRPAFFATSIHD